MYGAELDAEAFPRLKNDICSLTFKQHENPTLVRRLAIKLESEGRRLFRLLNERIPVTDSDDDETERYKTVLDEQAGRHLHNIRNIIDDLRELLSGKPVLDKYRGKCSQILWELANIRDQTAVFAKCGEIVYWLEKTESAGHRKPDEQEIPLLRAIPKTLNKMLHRDIWNKRVPVVLTSGTLSAGGSFDYVKRNTGLHLLREDRLLETSKPSPFNHRENALIYIGENMPFPDNKDKRYIAAVTDETERLIRVSHGHSAVLFTSYNVMGLVFEELQRRGLPVPMFKMGRSDTNAIYRFKQSGNGVMFASGALWEGIDLPGDILSMLIIVKLPFAVPDPVSEYERTLYGSMDEYKRMVVIPEMLVKLKQGFGRLLRSVTDTGIVAILDSRVRRGAPYRDVVLSSLPDCRVTDCIAAIEAFLRAKKSAAYFYITAHLKQLFGGSYGNR